MRSSIAIVIHLLVFSFPTFAQNEVDTTIILNEIRVEGYLYERPLSESAVSVGTLDQSALNRFNNTSILPAFNLIPGVKMEERSPGSNRLAIRGSSLRSPFGVRNVKVYWNDIPVTDAGGNTYLNVFDFASVNSVEVIKGPGGSLYGAGTGGVVLLHAKPHKNSGVEATATVGSFGLKRLAFRGDLSGRKTLATLNIVGQESDGYRCQTELTRKLISGEVSYQVTPRTSLAASYLVTSVSYGTPGALTFEQYKNDPEQPRPASGQFPGAKEQNAQVINEMLLAGISADHDWSDHFTSKLTIYFSHNEFENYAIANYESRNENNVGGRMENTWIDKTAIGDLRLSVGGEFQRMTSPIEVSENNGGAIGSKMISDDLTTTQTMLFAQAQLDLPAEFFFTAGLSSSWSAFTFERNFPERENEKASFFGILSPRIALLKKLGSYSIYTSVSKGFSPPTLAEVRPSTNAFNRSLNPETGINYEAGIRSSRRKVEADFTLYHFGLRNAIVLRRNEEGQEYFINAGEANQMGAELSAAWRPKAQWSVWTSWAYSYFRFRNFVRYDQYLERETNYSGNKVTGVPPLTASGGIDWNGDAGLYANLVCSYTDKIPLNDLNDEFAESYLLVNLKVGYRKAISEKLKLDIFAAVDNALDEKYSLGNDLNAARRRFYNAAPTRNYSVGINIKVM